MTDPIVKGLEKQGFEIVRKVSEGSFSRVYKVLDEDGFGKIVKVNLHHEEITDKEDVSSNVYDISKSWFSEEITRNEAEILKQLNHPNILKPVGLLKSFDSDDHWGLILENLENAVTMRDFLDDLIEHRVYPKFAQGHPQLYLELLENYPHIFDYAISWKNLNPKKMLETILQVGSNEISDIGAWLLQGSLLQYQAAARKRMAEHMTQLSSAAEYLRSKGIVHNDLKPGNILIDSVTSLKLIDFGISYNIDSPNGFWGSRLYSPPEKHINLSNINVDLWSLALIIFESLSGYHLFESEEPKNRIPMTSEAMDKLTKSHSKLLDSGKIKEDYAYPFSFSEFMKKLNNLYFLFADRENPLDDKDFKKTEEIYLSRNYLPLADQMNGICINPDKRYQQFKQYLENLVGGYSYYEITRKFVKNEGKHYVVFEGLGFLEAMGGQHN